MRRGTAGLLALALLASTAGAGDPPKPPKGAPPAGGRDLSFQERIDRAIERGVAWMRTKQAANGSFSWGFGGMDVLPGNVLAYQLGTTALGVHVLRSCGVKPDDPAVQRALERMRLLWSSGPVAQNYEVAIALLAFEAHYAPAPTGPGGELEPGKPSPPPRDIPEKDMTVIRALARRLVSSQNAGGGFGYGEPPMRWADLSNTQYALLGLKAARRCGVEVRKEVFRKAAEFVGGLQERSGPKVERKEKTGVDADGYGTRRSRAPIFDMARGFGYQSQRGATGSMTAAGVSSLVICRGELQGTALLTAKSDDLLVQAIRDGIAWLGQNFSVVGNPRANGATFGSWHYYYLYGLERAGVLAGVRWAASRDWYVEGATYLVKEQEDDGSWQSSDGRVGRRGGGRAAEGDFLDTSFALLFLKKATFRVEGAVATEEADDDLDLSGAAALDDDSFRAVFDTVFSRYLKAKVDRRGTLVGDFLSLGIRAIPFLIRLLEDEAPDRRAAAAEALHRLTGESQGYAADAPEEARAAAIASWEEWWFARRARLVADPGAGKFRDGAPGGAPGNPPSTGPGDGAGDEPRK